MAVCHRCDQKVDEHTTTLTSFLIGSDVVEQRHEAEVHVQLLVTVEQREAGIVGDKVDFDFLLATDHDDVFHHTGTRILLDILDELGVPSSPGTLSECAAVLAGISIPAGRFASLRRDEENAFGRDALSRPTWIVPALNAQGFRAIP